MDGRDWTLNIAKEELMRMQERDSTINELEKKGSDGPERFFGKMNFCIKNGPQRIRLGIPWTNWYYHNNVVIRQCWLWLMLYHSQGIWVGIRQQEEYSSAFIGPPSLKM